MEEVNKIEEAAPGVYAVTLWCPESYMLRELLDPDMPFVLCWDHSVGNSTWSDFRLPVSDPLHPVPVMSRVVNFDFLLPTEKFLEALPSMEPAIKAAQLGRVPPNYFDPKKVRGKPLFRLLDECGWHLLFETPSIDFGYMLSPKKEVLEKAVELMRQADEP